MPNATFPPFTLEDWQATRDTIHSYTQFLGAVRRTLTPPQKHWWHISLRATAAGLTTTPIRSENQVFELLLDLTHHRLLLTTNHGQRRDFALAGQSMRTFKEQVLEMLVEINVRPGLDPERFDSDAAGAYDKAAASDYWQAVSQIDAVFKELRHGFREESSPVQLWPHHFDLALLWFSGRLVPDQDPQKPEWSDEQMNFGFSTGDEAIPQPYFYITAYPTPQAWTETELPAGAYWQSEGWTGAVLPYAQIAGSDAGREQLLHFLKTGYEAGAALMK